MCKNVVNVKPGRKRQSSVSSLGDGQVTSAAGQNNRVYANDALRMREKIRVLQCTVNNLQDRDKERVFQVMQYNRLDGRKLATWLCTPAAQFALPKVFKRRQLRRFVTTGIRCQNALMGNVYDTNAHNHAIGLPPSYE
ncbi:uncharacterized protein LOC142588112 isoform X2 [Dermacentor variabilis]|uniref:uncharacterized protein LOC142588112 isoform X2 n=1 Tax=Dermacentor variabilis TaxID=34621 RepID=UPI003F5CB1F5